jgi:hypothetical protein
VLSLHEDGRIVHGEIAVDPHLHSAFLINTNLVLLNKKILGVLVDDTIALECLHEHVKIIGVGDIIDLRQSQVDVFNVDTGHVVVGADFFLVALDYEARLDHVGLSAPPVEGFEVVDVLFLTAPRHLKLVYLLPCFFVAKGAERPVLFRN